MTLEVGKRYAEFMGGDGVFLNVDDSGVTVLARMANPTETEINAFKTESPIQIDMGVLGSVVFWVMSFKGINAMDCTYSPKIVREKPVLPDPDTGMGYACLIMLADAANGMLLYNRLVTLPTSFSKALKAYIERADRSLTSYNASLNVIYNFSTSKLKKMATVTAKIGA